MVLAALVRRAVSETVPVDLGGCRAGLESAAWSLTGPEAWFETQFLQLS